MQKQILLITFLISIQFVDAQAERPYPTNSSSPDWIVMMYASDVNPGEVIKAHDLYFKSHSKAKNEHTQYYKRWIRSFSRSLDFDYSLAANQAYLDNSIALIESKAPGSAWTCIGPYDFDIDAASRSYAPGAAHVYTVERSVSNTSVMYAGTATAGLWKSIDGGQNWNLLTQNLVINQIRAIEIDYTNEDIVYFESRGDLYKTTDGGLNWAIIGDAVFQSDDHSVEEITMSPTNNSTLYLTSDYGFYRTTDGGNNWSEIMTGEFQEIELNPADPTMIYTIKVVSPKTEFYKSTDGGLSFTIQTTGWPNPVGANDHQERVEIAVTSANSNLIYANATGSANGGSGTYGIYISSDEGATWTFQCCGAQPAGPPSLTNINMMGWDKEGEDDGGQYYYDVGLAVDPIDENKLHLGGVNHWVSNDGGANWVCPAKWSEPAEPGYVHADIHDIRFFGNELWIACDGGIFQSTDGGTTMTKSMVGIEGTDFWGFGASTQSDVMLGGAYHNGTLLRDNSVYLNDWICTGGGDGVRGFVNFGNDRIAYDDYEGRVLPGDRTVSISDFQFDSLPNASYVTGASSNLEWDPRNYNHIYLGRSNNLLKTENNGQSYEVISTFTHDVMKVEIARTNLDVIYVTTFENWWGEKKVWRSGDAGVTWTDITPSNALLVNEFWVPYDITVSGTDENVLWAARTSQYSSYPNLNNKQVYKSIDGGITWTNYTTATLDGEWITNIVHQEGTDGGVYIGTRRAVYYRNNSLNDWILFNNNLPFSTASTKLVPKYKDRLLRNASNRSVYEVEMYETSEPIAQIAADRFKVNCKNEFVNYIDHSVLSSDNSTWQWSFPGGTPATSNMQNPIVQYTSTGTYDVSLTVTDDYGTSSQSYTAFITYEDITTNLDVIEDFEIGITSFWTQHNDNGSYGWSEFSTANGPYCAQTNCVMINHFDINADGDEAELITPKIDLTNALNAEIHFDYAYAKYGGGYEDGFRIDISTDCWSTYDSIWYAFGDSLSTVPNVNTWWEPADCADWSVNNIVDITSYIGQFVEIRFVGLNGWGNNFYMDNINIIGLINGLPENGAADVSIYPNPSKGNFIVEHSMVQPELKVLSLDGRLIAQKNLKSTKETINLNVSSGIYLVHLVSGEIEFVQRIVVE